MKGIILSGGAGSRLYPLTGIVSKQLQPVYDKPMIYYPLTTLIDCGIREIALISTPKDIGNYQKLLGDGKNFGVKIEYMVQPEPKGLPQAFTIGRSFIGDENVALILGDNIFGTSEIFEDATNRFKLGSTIFGYSVKDPQRYGVIELNRNSKPISIEEKPKKPKSDLAITGFYLFDNRVVEVAEGLKPSKRGELEITDLHKNYLARGELKVEIIPRGSAWLDAGTTSSLHEASSYVMTIEKRQGVKLGCPEESALEKGFVSKNEFKRVIERMPKCEYRSYLEEVLREHK